LAREKSPRDLVTEADLASQKVIRDVLHEAFPDHGFLGEESEVGSHEGGGEGVPEFCWIVDPLDGTANYVHGLPLYSVSVALEHRGNVLLGVVFNPVNEECFSAIAGGGAFLNGKPLRVSECRKLRDALVGSSFAADVRRGSDEIVRFGEVVVECQSVRRLGSAALTACYVAAGRLDAYWATSVKSWDVASGVVLAREAGGMVTAVDGSPFRIAAPAIAMAATPELHAELLRVLARRPIV
jgi:myo-inositol-1(or 4)-monophosphatase